MRKAILISALLVLSGVSFAQSNVKQNLANQVNELFVSTIDSNTNVIINVDKFGTINVMYKVKDENIDFNILDLSSIELGEPKDENPFININFHCKNCMHLTSPSVERRAKFNSNDLYLPVKYKALAMKMITKLEELQRQNR